MRKILFFGYIAAALTIANLARADVGYEAYTEVRSMKYDPTTISVMVNGVLPNPCARVIGRLAQDELDRSILLLKVAAISSLEEMCPAVRQGFADEIKLPRLMNDGIAINPEAKYLVKAEDIDYEFEVLGADLLQ